MLAQVVAECRRRAVDAIVELGDMKDQDDPPQPDRTRAYAMEIEAILQEAGVPIYHVLGNHEVDSLTKEEFLSLIRQPSGVPTGATFFETAIRDSRWLILDANFRPDGSSLTKGHLNWTDPTLPPAELAWLRTRLTTGAAPAIVAVHQRVDVDPPDPFAVRNAAAVREAMERSGRIGLVVQGHSHAGEVRRIGPIWYYTAAALVDSRNSRAPSWALLELGGGRLRIRGFGDSPSLELPWPAGGAGSDLQRAGDERHQDGDANQRQGAQR